MVSPLEYPFGGYRSFVIHPTPIYFYAVGVSCKLTRVSKSVLFIYYFFLTRKCSESPGNDGDHKTTTTTGLRGYMGFIWLCGVIWSYLWLYGVIQCLVTCVIVLVIVS